MNRLVKWGVKRWALGMVNTALADYNKSVYAARVRVKRYLDKLRALLAFLESLDEKIDDGKIDDAEADALVNEAEKLAEELVK